VPDAASGIVAVLKRLFNVFVRIVGVRGAREWPGFDGHYSGRNTVLVISESHSLFVQAIGLPHKNENCLP
jgi:hypothetical protein